MTGPGRGNGARQREEHHRHESQVAATEPHRMPGQLIECPVDLGLCKEERDADQHQEQLNREAREDVVEIGE